jgi:hypothetical protein
MTILDQRLTQTEDRLSTVLAHSRNLVSVPPQTASAQYPVSSNNPYFNNIADNSNRNHIDERGGHADYSYHEEDNNGQDSESDDSGTDGCDVYGDGVDEKDVQLRLRQGGVAEQDYSEDDGDEYSYGQE